MDTFFATSVGDVSMGLPIEEEYVSQSKLLKDFISLPNIEKAWIFKSHNGKDSNAMLLFSQANLLSNARKKFVVFAHISKEHGSTVNFQWMPFPIELAGVSAVVPSPSGSRFLVVRNPENESTTKLEIWNQSGMEKEFSIPQTVHGSIYLDKWFEGISWNSNEDLIAYVAEDAKPPRPVYNFDGFDKFAIDKDHDSWKGQGELEDDWGETYAAKRQPVLFVININSGNVQRVKGIMKSLSVGQVTWAPFKEGSHQYLVFVGWPSERKLGMKYCYNRPCALYAVAAPLFEFKHHASDGIDKEMPAFRLTHEVSSAFWPLFSPDGSFLLFLSAKSCVDSGAHSGTLSLHKIDWKSCLEGNYDIVVVVPVVQYPEQNCFPGLYFTRFLHHPWIHDGTSLVLTSIWGSIQVLLSVNILSGEVKRITPSDSMCSWDFLSLDGDNILVVSSSPVDIPRLKYGYLVEAKGSNFYYWLDVSGPMLTYSEKVKDLLSSRDFRILNIPVKDPSVNELKGDRFFEAIFVSNRLRNEGHEPLIVVLHGGPHAVSLTSFSRSLAFLTCTGCSLLMVNYRGSLGYGEEMLQTLPGKVGSQDVADVLAAIDHVISIGLAESSMVGVLGGSHGGFLTSHLIGQAPNRFYAAAVMNPVCNLALMVGTTDIPDWCYFEAYGSNWKEKMTESPSSEDIVHFHSVSPIAHVSKVKTPTLFLLGAKDLRVPFSNGLQATI